MSNLRNPANTGWWKEKKIYQKKLCYWILDSKYDLKKKWYSWFDSKSDNYWLLISSIVQYLLWITWLIVLNYSSKWIRLLLSQELEHWRWYLCSVQLSSVDLFGWHFHHLVNFSSVIFYTTLTTHLKNNQRFWNLK